MVANDSGGTGENNAETEGVVIEDLTIEDGKTRIIESNEPFRLTFVLGEPAAKRTKKAGQSFLLDFF